MDEKPGTTTGMSVEQDVELPLDSKALLALLGQLGIGYELHHHAPIFTMEEGEHLKADIPGLHCRNLFLRDKKKAMFLVVVGNDMAVDLKKLETDLGSARLSFGSPDRLWEFLGIRPGSVNPFCVFNDKDHKVQVVLDANMMKAETMNVHPMDNAMTVSIAPHDLLKFFDHTDHEPITLAF